MTYEQSFGPALIIQHTGQVFPLTQEAVTIGRQADNRLVLADPKVSSHHAIIFWQADLDIFVIQDLGSTNGTYVNEQRVIDPQPLRQGDVVRTGDTVMEVKLDRARETVALTQAGYYDPATSQDQGTQSGNLVLPGIIITLLVGITIACLVLVIVALLSRGRGVPNVIIQSPPEGTQVITGNEIILQATASGTSDITLVELNVDGKLVATATSPDPNGRSTLSVRKPWMFATSGSHAVSAVAYTAQGKSSKMESVEITAIESGAGVPPGATATSTAVIEETSTPTPPPGAPQIEYFRANPQTINAGECTVLEWGMVADATEARIDPGVGGVATPGSNRVCPSQTTTYVLTASGPGGTTTAPTTVTVSGALADLVIDSITFAPNPAVQGQDTEVKITIRNAGKGPAGAFNWDWQAGEEASFDGRLGGIGPGETTAVSVRWRPSRAYGSLSTVARVDTDSEVPELDKGNNQLMAVVKVEEGAGASGTVTLQSDPGLDGYRGNSGGGGTGQDVIVGNGGWSGPTDEKVWRGFMSFDLSGLPRGVSIRDAELRFYQAKVEGAPYQKLGNLILDHVDYGANLGRAAYDTPALGSTALAPQPSAGAWYIVPGRPISDWIGQDLADGRDRFQLRIRWAQEKDGDDLEDYASMEPGNNFFGSGNIPMLVVSYGP